MLVLIVFILIALLLALLGAIMIIGGSSTD